MQIGGLQKCSLIDYPGKVAAIVFTVGCNFRCPYCHNPELVNETVSRIYTEEEIFDFLEARVRKLDAVVITGGEPTLHNDLIPFIEKIKALGFLVKLDSNGTNPGVLADVITKKCVDYIAMDIKAPLQKYHTVTNMPVDISAIQKSIALIMESNILYEFRTTINKALTSPEDVEDMARLISGADVYYLQKFVSNHILNPQLKRTITYTDEEFEKLLDRAKPYVKTCAIR